MIEYDWFDTERDWHTSTLDGIVFGTEEKAKEFCSEKNKFRHYSEAYKPRKVELR